MPLLDTPADAISTTYAHSLFELAKADGGQSAIESALAELDEFADLARSDKQFGEFISSQVISADRRAASFDRIFRGKLSNRVLDFLLVLNDKGRLGHLLGIVTAFDGLVQKAFGRVEVDVWTAAPMEAGENQELQRRLAEKLGSQVVLHAYTDPNMVGGIRIQVGDQLLDASIASQLRSIRQQLTENGPARVRASADRLFRGDPSSNGH